MLHRTARPVLLLALCALSLAACAPPLPPPAISPALLMCAARPSVPDNPDDAALAEFILALDERGEDCAGRLVRIREVLLP